MSRANGHLACHAIVTAWLVVGGCAARPVVTAPPLEAAFVERDGFGTSLARTTAWLDRPGDSPAPFVLPDGRVLSRDDLCGMIAAMEAILAEAGDGAAFGRAVAAEFDVRPVVAADGDDVAHFTAYYAPEYEARRERTDQFRFPLYRVPAELAPDNPDRRTWHARRAIERDDLLAGRELAWLPDALSAYLVQVNGSARLRLGDGTSMHIGHAATNERAYTSLGRLLIDAGRVAAADMSMDAIRVEFERDPQGVEALMLLNDRYVFFEALEAKSWPRSSFGIPLTPHASAATDPSLVPPGAILLVETTLPDGTPYVRLMVSQDTGGAIRGAARADLYFGVGEHVGAVAGRMNTTGRLSMLLPRR